MHGNSNIKKRGNRFLRNQTAGRHIPNTKIFHQHWFINSHSTDRKDRPNRKSEKETCKESDKETRKRIAWMFICEEKLLASHNIRVQRVIKI
jgi:hypothetical protein